LDSPRVNQLQVDFVSQCGGLQGFAGAPSEIQPCDPPEFRIDKGGIKRSSASLLPLFHAACIPVMSFGPKFATEVES
jgi:hypothetical protein